MRSCTGRWRKSGRLHSRGRPYNRLRALRSDRWPRCRPEDQGTRPRRTGRRTGPRHRRPRLQRTRRPLGRGRARHRLGSRHRNADRQHSRRRLGSHRGTCLRCRLGATDSPRVPCTMRVRRRDRRCRAARRYRCRTARSPARQATHPLGRGLRPHRPNRHFPSRPASGRPPWRRDPLRRHHPSSDSNRLHLRHTPKPDKLRRT